MKSHFDFVLLTTALVSSASLAFAQSGLTIRETNGLMQLAFTGPSELQYSSNLTAWASFGVQNSPYTDLDSASLGARFYKLNRGSVDCETVVGFYRLNLAQGYALIANQLDNGKGNRLVDVIPSPPNGTLVFKFNGTGYAILDYADGAWEGDDLNMTLAPGEGAFIHVAIDSTNTFLGEILSGDLSRSIPTGYSIVSSRVPISGWLFPDLNYQPASGDFVFQFNRVTGGYRLFDYADFPFCSEEGCEIPLLGVGDAFFIKPGSTNNWTQNFCVH